MADVTLADEQATVEPESPEQQAAALEGSGYRNIARGQMRGRATPEGLEPLPTVSDEASYDALEPGKKYKDPQGNVRTKNYTVADEFDYASVPEGAQYNDPEGNLRTKPAYQDVSFTAHTLYNMSVNDKERYNALKRSYPDAKIEQGPDGDFTVEEADGTLRKPRRAADPKAGPLQTAALVASGAAPTVGAVGGEVAGGIIGGLPSAGVGTIPGAIAGAGVGSALGQTFNDLFLKWAGVYDRSLGEQLTETGLAAGFGAGGTAVGRGVAAAYPYVKGKISTGAPGAVAGALGAEREALETSLRLGQEGEHESSSRILRSWGMTDPGTPTPISSWAKETPMMHIEQEVLHPTFFTQEPLQQAKAAKMESGGKQILEGIGATVEGSLVEPVAAVSGREAGQKLLDRAMAQSAKAEEDLAAEIARRRATAEAGMAAQMPEHEARMASLRTAARAADDAATRVVNAGYQDIRSDVDNAMRAARAGHNNGDFWTSVADKLREIRQGISARATHRYGQWEQVHGAIVPEQEGLAASARAFIDDIPQPFRDMKPTLIRKLARLAGEETAEEGAEQIAPATLAELHDIRSLFRSSADWSDLASDVKNGSMKRFAVMLDDVMHGGRNATPELRTAARDLDVVDTWYAKNIKIFNDQRVQAIVDGLKNGQPADPKALVDLMIRENNTDLNNKLRRMLGPNLWAGIRGAHADNLIRSNQTLAGTVDGAGFARDVLADYNSGLLRSIHGEEGAARLFRQAQLAAALEGKLDVAVRPGDTVMDVIASARAAARAIQEEAERNPLALLKKEMTRLKQQEQQELKAARAETAKDPLRFLYNRSTGAAEAVDKILKKEDLVIAVEARFGRDSAEFQALQQVAAQRILSGTLSPGSRLAAISPEVQEMLFGMKLADAQLLARDMEFLVGGREAGGTGSSILATSKVTHPWSSILGRGGSVSRFLTAPLKIIPGSDYAGRTLLASYYDLKVKMLESPSFQRWVLKGLKGDDRAREMVRETVQRAMQRGGAVGAGVGEAGYQRERVSEPPAETVSPPSAPDRRSSLRDEGRVASDAIEDLVRPGQQYAMNVKDPRKNQDKDKYGVPKSPIKPIEPLAPYGTGAIGPGALRLPARASGRSALGSSKETIAKGVQAGQTDKQIAETLGGQLSAEEVRTVRTSFNFQEYLKEAGRGIAGKSEPQATSVTKGGMSSLRQAYDDLKTEQRGISNIWIGDLIERSGLSKAQVHAALLEAAKRGEVTLHNSNIAWGNLAKGRQEGSIMDEDRPLSTVVFKKAQ